MCTSFCGGGTEARFGCAGAEGEDDCVGCSEGSEGFGSVAGTSSGVEETIRGLPCSSTVISWTAG